MPTYDALRALPDGAPGPWGESVEITYDQRDVLLYAVGVGVQDLRYVYEGHSDFSVFPIFPIRWGSTGAPIDEAFIPRSPLPLMIDAERYRSIERPLPIEGTVSVRSRVIGIHPRGKGNGFVECEMTVTDADGNLCVSMANGSFRRGVDKLGDIEPFEGSGQTYSTKLMLPDAPRFGGFDKPILHGLCTFGHCADLLLGVLFEVRVDDKVVVSNAYFEYDAT